LIQVFRCSGVQDGHGGSTDDLNTRTPEHLNTALFGEGPSRIVISVRPEARTAVEARLAAAGVPGEWLGTVGGPALVIGDAVNVAVSAMEETWTQTLPHIMEPGRRD